LFVGFSCAENIGGDGFTKGKFSLRKIERMDKPGNPRDLRASRNKHVLLCVELYVSYSFTGYYHDRCFCRNKALDILELLLIEI
jgi:hypothetical protein